VLSDVTDSETSEVRVTDPEISIDSWQIDTEIFTDPEISDTDPEISDDI
jgi:hypothetical protein